MQGKTHDLKGIFANLERLGRRHGIETQQERTSTDHYPESEGWLWQNVAGNQPGQLLRTSRAGAGFARL